YRSTQKPPHHVRARRMSRTIFWNFDFQAGAGTSRNFTGNPTNQELELFRKGARILATKRVYDTTNLIRTDSSSRVSLSRMPTVGLLNATSGADRPAEKR